MIFYRKSLTTLPLSHPRVFHFRKITLLLINPSPDAVHLSQMFKLNSINPFNRLLYRSLRDFNAAGANKLGWLAKKARL